MKIDCQCKKWQSISRYLERFSAVLLADPLAGRHSGNLFERSEERRFRGKTCRQIDLLDLLIWMVGQEFFHVIHAVVIDELRKRTVVCCLDAVGHSAAVCAQCHSHVGHLQFGVQEQLLL